MCIARVGQMETAFLTRKLEHLRQGVEADRDF